MHGDVCGNVPLLCMLMKASPGEELEEEARGEAGHSPFPAQGAPTASSSGEYDLPGEQRLRISYRCLWKIVRLGLDIRELIPAAGDLVGGLGRVVRVYLGRVVEAQVSLLVQEGK